MYAEYRIVKSFILKFSAQSLVLEVTLPSHEHKRSCIYLYVRGISILLLFLSFFSPYFVFLLNFRNVPTVQYLFIFSLLCERSPKEDICFTLHVIITLSIIVFVVLCNKIMYIYNGFVLLGEVWVIKLPQPRHFLWKCLHQARKVRRHVFVLKVSIVLLLPQFFYYILELFRKCRILFYFISCFIVIKSNTSQKQFEDTKGVTRRRTDNTMGK